MSCGAVEQGDEADEAGASDGASQLISGVRLTLDRRGEMTEVTFAGQLTEADYGRLNALVARRTILAWSAVLALVVGVQLWQ